MAVDGLDEQRVQLGGDVRGGRDVAAQRVEEQPLKLAPEGEQRGVPLLLVGHAVEPAVVHLVAAVEGELQVVAVRVGVVDGGRMLYSGVEKGAS